VTERIRKENLLAHLQQLVGGRNAISHRRELQRAADYITRQFQTLGYDTSTDDVCLLCRRYPNIIAEATRSRSDAPLFIVGAHYDTVHGSPGADDNASGVAALLEIARVLAESLKAHRGPHVQFVAFTLEEEGMAGSTHYSRVLSKRHVNLRAMVSLEMVGFKSDAPNSQQLPPGLDHLYPHVGNFIGIVGNDTSRALLETFVTAMKTVEDLPVESLVVPGNGEAIPPTRLSDHSPFWDIGYPALMITDTSWFRNPHYHQASDTIDTLDLDFMARVGDGVARAIENLNATF
jgi:Zn-dependent M28 family amino/carboxypeptidase